MIRRLLMFAALLTLFAVPASAATWVHTFTADTVTVGGSADSTAILTTYDAQLMSITLATDKPCKLALQVLTWGDSNSVAGGQTAAVIDTAKSSVWAWAPSTIFYTASSDSITYTPVAEAGGGPSRVLNNGRELMVLFQPVTAAGGWRTPRQQTIWLADLSSGMPLRCRQIRVRWRILQSAQIAQGTAVTVRGWLTLNGASYQ
jgi:hypothetical protein